LLTYSRMSLTPELTFSMKNEHSSLSGVLT